MAAAMNDRMLDALREWLAVSNPGLVTQEDLQRLEDRVDRLLEIADAIEERLAARLDDASSS